MGRMHHSPKQREIMGLICGALSRGEEITTDDLHERLSYGATASRAAVLCSLKFLEKHGMVSKQPRINRTKAMLLLPTERGLAHYGPKISEPDDGDFSH